MKALLSDDLWRKLSEQSAGHQRIRAAIAYVTAPYLDFRHSDLLICDASDDAIKGGMTSASLLRLFVGQGAEVYSYDGLHSKVAVIDEQALIGSANLSENAGVNTCEASLLTDDLQVVGLLQAFIEKVKGESEPVNDNFLRRIEALPVVRNGGIARKSRGKIEVGQSKVTRGTRFAPSAGLESHGSVGKVANSLSPLALVQWIGLKNDRHSRRREKIMIASDPKMATPREEDALSHAELLAAYELGIDDLRAAVAGMTAEQLRARPIAGKWSTLEVVCHLAGTEIYFTDRIERTAALERPLLMAVDERPYPERLNYQTLDVGEELDLFAALRRHAARILRLQPPEAWERTAVHSHNGLVTLRQLVLQAVRHLRHHLAFIAEKRAALRV